ncbi:jg7892 [Pararge aegeria aegeria]|uniref:lysozyme n=1 Tax=Pararge aegeria aegeria TaxID=348720 RepID=A0A8S4RBC8_9NEOP|nr:jg7892 [Pararge aegeria aegeria]
MLREGHQFYTASYRYDRSLSAYASCTNDPHCAADCVQGYMRKFGQDCNGDGVVNCYDYMAIHKLGGYGCKGDLPFQYVNVFNQCVAAVAQAQQG